MPTRQFILVASLFLRAALADEDDDRRWREAVEFWSDVVCSLENGKIVHLHRPMGADRADSRRFDEIILRVAWKCESTILSRTYPTDEEEEEKRPEEEEEASKSSSIWGITSDYVDVLEKPAKVKATPRKAGDPSYEKNTWNVHVVLARDVRSLDRLLLDESFRWNSWDRFVVLIARRSVASSDIGNILRRLWHERKAYNVYVSDGGRLASTYNPFFKANESAWGGIDVARVNTAIRSANLTTRRRAENLHGHELKVGIFERSQAGEARHDYSDVFKGFDETMLDIVAERMNFTARRVHPTDNRSYGYQLSNGTYVGAIGDVVYGRTDICFESFFAKKYSPAASDEPFEFTTQVEFDRVCVIAPKARKIPKWLRIYHFFPLSIWIFSMLSHVLTCVAWYTLQVFDPRRRRRVSFLGTVYRSFLFNCGCPQKLPRTNAERILLCGVFLGNVTMVGFFNGMLYRSFAGDMYYRDIDSLEELDESGLPILFTSFGMSDLFGPEDDPDAVPVIQSLKRKLRHGGNTLKNAATYRNVTGLIRKYHFAILNEELVDADGAPLLHLVTECPGTYYLSYLLPRHSVLRDRVNTLISQLNQAGLPTLWTSRTIRHTVLRKKLLAERGENQEASHFVPFRLSDVQTSFFTLLTGLSLSTIVFFYEKGWLRAPPCLRRPRIYGGPAI